MTTTTSYYDHSYSPPISPKSQPHGCKRKALSQEDELENQHRISNSFKRLRLNNAKRPSAARIAPIGVSYRDVSLADAFESSHLGTTSPYPGPVNYFRQGSDDDLMPVDDTADRIWVHDLDAEIAEIEAEEERQKAGIQLSEAGKEYSKIPDHLLKQKVKAEDPAANMQMILYRDPISISVPEENDAVRKTIIEARRRMREKQAEERHRERLPLPANSTAAPSTEPSGTNQPDDAMDMDID